MPKYQQRVWGDRGKVHDFKEKHREKLFQGSRTGNNWNFDKFFGEVDRRCPRMCEAC